MLAGMPWQFRLASLAINPLANSLYSFLLWCWKEFKNEKHSVNIQIFLCGHYLLSLLCLFRLDVLSLWFCLTVFCTSAVCLFNSGLTRFYNFYLFYLHPSSSIDLSIITVVAILSAVLAAAVWPPVQKHHPGRIPCPFSSWYWWIFYFEPNQRISLSCRRENARQGCFHVPMKYKKFKTTSSLSFAWNYLATNTELGILPIKKNEL